MTMKQLKRLMMRLIAPELLEDNLQQLKLRDRHQMAKKKKRVRRVPKDKETDLPKKYLSGLKGQKKISRAALLKRMSSII